jgi:hypothetical protein
MKEREKAKSKDSRINYKESYSGVGNNIFSTPFSVLLII